MRLPYIPQKIFQVIPTMSQCSESDFPVEAEIEVEDNSHYCVISTGLVKRKRDQFIRFLSSFNISTTKNLDDDVTHVVIDVTDQNCAVRTLKYIQVNLFVFLYCQSVLLR